MSTVPAYILGQAQASFHDRDAVEHPLVLMQDIALRALTDAALDPHQVDAVGCVDPYTWTYSDLTQSLSRGIGLPSRTREFWVPASGTAPQDLLHNVSQAMAAKEIDVALLVGAEAMRTRRKATRAGQELAWPPRDRSVKPTRGQKPFTSDWEAQHGLRLPIQSFPLHENALRAAYGRSAQEQIDLAAGLLHKNALVAADNPFAWFQDAPSIASIATVSPENRMIAYPYTKRMNAIMDVDQAAAIVVVSQRFLESTTNTDQAIAVLGGAGAEEVWNPIERHDLARSLPMRLAFEYTLKQAGLTIGEVDAFDFYSCFPSPVQMALEALEVPLDDPRPFSLTGGLAYAGGPGNNYVMHAIATAVERLRQNPKQRLLVTGVGMANTKHAGTALAHASNVPANATGSTTYRLETGETPLPVAQQAQGEATIVSYTIEYARDGQASNVIYLLNLDSGERAIANSAAPDADATTLHKADPVGQRGLLRWDAKANRQFFEIST